MQGRNQRVGWVGQTHFKIHLTQLWFTQVTEQNNENIYCTH